MWSSKEENKEPEEGEIEGQEGSVEKEEKEKKEPEEPKPIKSEILGGFFIFRASPSSKNLDEAMMSSFAPVEGEETQKKQGEGGDYSQKGELVGMVLIKQKGNRKFLGFVQIDPESNTVDKFMTNFVDTDLSNQLDNSKTNVFEYSFLDKLIERCVLQKIEIPGRDVTEGETEGETWKDSGTD